MKQIMISAFGPPAVGERVGIFPGDRRSCVLNGQVLKGCDVWMAGEGAKERRDSERDGIIINNAC